MGAGVGTSCVNFFLGLEDSDALVIGDSAALLLPFLDDEEVSVLPMALSRLGVPALPTALDCPSSPSSTTCSSELVRSVFLSKSSELPDDEQVEDEQEEQEDEAEEVGEAIVVTGGNGREA